MIAESWNIKKSIHKSISSKKLDDFYSYASSKLLGAGGGGFFLLYVKDKIIKNF